MSAPLARRRHLEQLQPAQLHEQGRRGVPAHLPGLRYRRLSGGARRPMTARRVPDGGPYDYSAAAPMWNPLQSYRVGEETWSGLRPGQPRRRTLERQRRPARRAAPRPTPRPGTPRSWRSSRTARSTIRPSMTIRRPSTQKNDYTYVLPSAEPQLPHHRGAAPAPGRGQDHGPAVGRDPGPDQHHRKRVVGRVHPDLQRQRRAEALFGQAVRRVAGILFRPQLDLQLRGVPEAHQGPDHHAAGSPARISACPDPTALSVQHQPPDQWRLRQGEGHRGRPAALPGQRLRRAGAVHAQLGQELCRRTGAPARRHRAVGLFAGRLL